MCIPLMANGMEHFFGYLFVICISSSLVAQMVKCLPTMQETQVQSLGREDLLEKETATHSSILAWVAKSQARLSHFTISSSVKCFFVFFCPWSNWLLLSFESSFYVLDTSTLLDMWLANVFSQSVACVFMLLTGSFREQKFFHFDEILLTDFFLL